MADDFNSSDVEFDPPAETKQAYSWGQDSIELLLANAESDRLSTKRTVKQLEYGHGAPKTKGHQTRWLRRFHSYRENTLKQSLTTPFTGDDIIRFFDAIIRKFGCSPGRWIESHVGPSLGKLASRSTTDCPTQWHLHVQRRHLQLLSKNAKPNQHRLGLHHFLPYHRRTSPPKCPKKINESNISSIRQHTSAQGAHRSWTYRRCYRPARASTHNNHHNPRSTPLNARILHQVYDRQNTPRWKSESAMKQAAVCTPDGTTAVNPSPDIEYRDSQEFHASFDNRHDSESYTAGSAKARV